MADPTGGRCTRRGVLRDRRSGAGTIGKLSAFGGMAAESRSFDPRVAGGFDSTFVDGEIAYADRAPDDELRQSYFCTICQQRVAKQDLAAIFHHRQRGHRPLTDVDYQPVESLSDQITKAFDQALRPR